MDLGELDECSDGMIWQNADDQIYALRLRQGPAYLDRARQFKFERVRQARLLYRSKHRTFFMTEQRTQQPFKEIDVNGRRMQPFFVMNVLRMISRKTADLLFGEEAEIKVDDEIQQARLHELIERTALAELLKDAAIAASWQGDTFVESCVHQGEVYLQVIPADQVYPEGVLGPDRQYAAYERFQPRNAGTVDKPNWLLLVTRYEAGRNTRTLWSVDPAGNKQGNPLPIEQWTTLTGQPPLVESEITGVPWPTITWVPNELEEGRPVSDYDGLIGLQDLLNHKQTQIALILQQHSDPWMTFPRDMADSEGNIRAKFKAFFADDPAKGPAYLTYDAKLDSAMKDRQETRTSLIVAAEMSAVLLGLDEGGAAPESYNTLRLRSQNALAMAARKGKTWKSAIRLILETAQALDQSIPGNRYDRGAIGVNLRDGLAIDEKEQADTLSELKAAGLLSVQRGVSILIPDQAGQAKELAELEKAAAAQAALMTPSVLLGEGANPNDQASHDTQHGQDARATGSAA